MSGDNDSVPVRDATVTRSDPPQLSGTRRRVHNAMSIVAAMCGLGIASGFILMAFGVGMDGRSFGRPPFGVSLFMVSLVVLIVAAVVKATAAAGLAGSGVVLDPKQARKDLEPFSRQAGGMLRDALDEVGVNLGQAEAKDVVMIRCRECARLNEEDSKFCQECGKPI
jgi:hypothetical protein